MVADDTYMADDDYLAAYQQYVNDLVLDGWKLAEILVSPDDVVTGVHEQIQTIYDTIRCLDTCRSGGTCTGAI